jgi:hypothetical protein
VREAAGIDGAGDAVVGFEQAEEIDLFVVAVDVVFLVGLEGGVSGIEHGDYVRSRERKSRQFR